MSWGSFSSGSDVYAFRASVSDASSERILAVMEDIFATLRNIGTAIDELEPAWAATEADTYYEMIKEWKSGAAQITGILRQVDSALNSVKTGTDELRTGITDVLNETQ